MNFIENMYVGESVDDIETVYYSLKRGIPVFNTFCICINEKSKNTFDILSTRELFSPKNSNIDYTIIGVAFGKKEALSLLQYILKDSIKKGVSVLDIKRALKEGDV